MEEDKGPSIFTMHLEYTLWGNNPPTLKKVPCIFRRSLGGLVWIDRNEKGVTNSQPESFVMLIEV